jgi:hypothetical protein
VHRLQAEGKVVPIPVEAEPFVSSSYHLDLLSRTLSFLLSGYRSSSPTVKLPGCDIYHSHISRAEVKNAWSYTVTPPICLHVVVTNNFTLFMTRGYSTAHIYFPFIL